MMSREAQEKRGIYTTLIFILQSLNRRPKKGGTTEKGARKHREQEREAKRKSREADVQDAQPATGQYKLTKEVFKHHAGKLYRK